MVLETSLDRLGSVLELMKRLGVTDPHVRWFVTAVEAVLNGRQPSLDAALGLRPNSQPNPQLSPGQRHPAMARGRPPSLLHLDEFKCLLWVKTRRTGASPGRSAPGGEADEIGGEADIAA